MRNVNRPMKRFVSQVTKTVDILLQQSINDSIYLRIFTFKIPENIYRLLYDSWLHGMKTQLISGLGRRPTTVQFKPFKLAGIYATHRFRGA